LNYRNKKLLELCRQLPCQVCGRNNGTVVAAHRNEGKGMGLKVSDALVCSMCFECHSEMDNGKSLTKDERRDMWNRAFISTMKEFIEREWLVVK
jgi:hypothetical protein